MECAYGPHCRPGAGAPRNLEILAGPPLAVLARRWAHTALSDPRKSITIPAQASHSCSTLTATLPRGPTCSDEKRRSPLSCPSSRSRASRPFEPRTEPLMASSERRSFPRCPVFAGERFPNVVVTRTGTVLAVQGSSRITCRRKRGRWRELRSRDRDRREGLPRWWRPGGRGEWGDPRVSWRRGIRLHR